MKLLIATDGSENGKHAVDYGASLAKMLGAEVIAVFVINMRTLELHALSHHDDITGYEILNDTLKSEGEEALKHAAEACSLRGVKVETRLLRGYPGSEIVKMAEELNIDMIVVGRLGKTGLEHLLMGSVSGDVVRHARCPVLVVRGPR